MKKLLLPLAVLALAHGVGAALDVLDGERGDDIQAGVEQFRHVLPAFRVTRAGGVRVREFSRVPLPPSRFKIAGKT